MHSGPRAWAARRLPGHGLEEPRLGPLCGLSVARLRRFNLEDPAARDARNDIGQLHFHSHRCGRTESTRDPDSWLSWYSGAMHMEYQEAATVDSDSLQPVGRDSH